MAHQLLLILLDGASRENLERAVENADEGDLAVYVVGPRNVGPLDWLATDERRASAAAAARVLEAEWLLAERDELGGEVGDRDLVLAVHDALEHVPADEIAIVGSGAIDPQLLQQLRAFGLPLTLTGLSEGADSATSRVRSATRGVTSGRSAATPFVAFLAANLGFLVIAVVLSVLAGVIVWLIESYA